ncbi:pullulanase X25 domain-containing protein [Pyxidicoccus xibeiensis]|uniref:pullulanase X25 domain-containing protein n=1 Tax=Pyxidicoccus xibeiensis TaxID=2906759 RepID=UPI0020A77A36|nr:MYXO-CTERM sorting domain-containing protein [Pyxidicoccus xibeiensis]MCP3142136.1 hypothetical protein [Pyxidicoccus xibeiensis]
MRPFRFMTPECLRACAVLLALLCTPAFAQPGPSSVTIVGSFQSELGCAGDWEPACANTWLERDAEDGIWRKLFTVPAGEQRFKAAINNSWDENYGANAQLDGPDLVFSHTEPAGVKFYYDPVTHWITNSTLTPIAVLAGSMQSELGCPGDWDPGCMITWLKDIDGDGTQELRIPSLPAGTYELKVAHHESWDENYGANGVPGGDNIVFTVPATDQEILFSYNSSTHLLTIQVGTPDAGPGDLDGGTDAGSATDAGSDAGPGDIDAGPGGGTDAGPGDIDAGPGGGTDAGPGESDAGPGGGTDAGPGESDAGPGGGTDAGPGDTDAGPGGGTDAGPGDTDAGSGGGTDAGPGDTDAGSGGGTDAGPGDADAGSNTDAGAGDTDAGTNTDAGTGDADAGTQVPDAGAGNADAGTSPPPPGNDEETTGCNCGASTGGGAPLLLLGMWMGLSFLQARRRARLQSRG